MEDKGQTRRTYLQFPLGKEPLLNLDPRESVTQRGVVYNLPKKNFGSLSPKNFLTAVYRLGFPTSLK